MNEEKKKTIRENFRLTQLITTSNILSVVGIIVSILLALGLAYRCFGPDNSFGNCALTAVKPAYTRTVISHFQGGMRYEQQNQYAFARREFSELLAIDPHFLGANLNMGSMYLSEGNNDKAEEYLNKERDSIECLKTLSESELSHFAYMLGSNDESTETGYKKRLQHAEDIVHYDLACLRIKQQDRSAALSEAIAAAKNCTIPHDTFYASELKALTSDAAVSRALNQCAFTPR